MKPLTYRIIPESENTGSVRLEPCDVGEILPAMWDQLAGDIAAEPTLMASPASVLASRCRAGFGAAAIHQGRVLSYRALVPIVHRGAGAPSWEILTRDLDLRGAPLPETSIYCFTNSWTAPEWRGRGISLALRPLLVDRFLTGNNLAILNMDGLASRLPGQMGWQIMAWDRVPFLSSLVSLPASEFPDQAAATASLASPLGLRRYQGPHVPLDDPAHPWKEYLHFWVSDAALAEKLDRQLHMLFDGDLRCWRTIIVAVYSAPDIMWQISFDVG